MPIFMMIFPIHMIGSSLQAKYINLPVWSILIMTIHNVFVTDGGRRESDRLSLRSVGRQARRGGGRRRERRGGRAAAAPAAPQAARPGRRSRLARLCRCEYSYTISLINRCAKCSIKQCTSEFTPSLFKPKKRGESFWKMDTHYAWESPSLKICMHVLLVGT